MPGSQLGNESGDVEANLFTHVQPHVHPHGRARGASTQSRILETAVQIASVEGLDAMSLATLAGATQMSKSGLFAHFRSKEALQLAIIDEAERLFSAAVLEPPASKRGLARLRGLAESYITYAAGKVFQGGCFFAAAIHEFDGRPGLVRERLGAWLERWHGALGDACREAQVLGEMTSSISPEQIAFEISGIGLSTNLHTQMRDAERARTAGLAAANALMDRIVTRALA